MVTSSAFAAAAPYVSPDRSSFLHAGSPLNPRRGHSNVASGHLKTTATANVNTATTTTTTTRIHLANLERLLQKQTPAPRSPPPAMQSLPNPGKDPDDPPQRGLINALNLCNFLPSWSRDQTSEQDMSPRSLTRLHRLLSNSARPSPRGTIARGWQQYHGANDWAGLLDPLDENLRRELVRYGDFVHAAYHAFHSNPAAPPGLPRPLFLPDRNYRVTRSLFATASVELPPWVDRLVDPSVAQRSSWIGYVAVCDNERETQRMGRRDIVIALRGTSTCLEWAENFRAGLVPVDDELDGTAADRPPSRHVPRVECGFRSLYKTPGSSHLPSLSEAIVEEVLRLVELYEGEELSVTVTGHSLGAALAVLAADELRARLSARVPVAVFSFGGPRVGNRAFADRVERRGVKVLRVVNTHDVVTRVPGVLPARGELARSLGKRWPSHVLEGVDGYSHVGKELKVDHRLSPYLRPDADPACCHDLEAYLHLVDGFTGTNCPFRSNAKRSLARLLDQQGANVKKLYISKVRSLKLDLSPAVYPEFARCGSGQLASPSSLY